MGQLQRIEQLSKTPYFEESGRGALLQWCIRFALSNNNTPAVVYGPAGIGKSMLLRCLHDHLGHSRRVVYLRGLTSSQSVLLGLCKQLNISCLRDSDDNSLPLKVANSIEAAEYPVVVLIDDAQEFSEAMMAGLVAYFSKLKNARLFLAVDTFGAGGLRQDLRNNNVQALAMRVISRSCLHKYLRMKTPNAHFSPEDLALIYRLSVGVPERINAAAVHVLRRNLAARYSQQEARPSLMDRAPSWLAPWLARLPFVSPQPGSRYSIVGSAVTLGTVALLIALAAVMIDSNEQPVHAAAVVQH